MPLPIKPVKALGGWGGWPTGATSCVRPERVQEFVPQPGVQIARGQGRSYGDASFCSEGTTLLTERMNRFLSFDSETGVLTAEAGATLAEVLNVFVPKGWFLPVTPGTKFCSLGGCLAADVHGKNHHIAGSFSQHVPRAVVMDASGRRRSLGPDRDPDFFWATAGGMGLTGLITEVSLQLKPIETSYIRVKHRAAGSLAESLELFSDPSCDDHYSVAWIDCLASGQGLGRTVLMTGHHMVKPELPSDVSDPLLGWKQGPLRVPFNFPNFALNPVTVRAFNAVYGWIQGRKTEFTAHFDKFFYPLDGVAGWNKIYGKRGFVQYQFVLPLDQSKHGLTRILERLSRSGHGSFLAVLKKFGPGGQGHLSFPTEGFTLALDIPLRNGLLEFLDQMDEIVADHGGRHYLAKDSRLSAKTAQAMLARLPDFRQAALLMDPEGRFRSDLSRRLELLP
jgi:decaprenylphospho-beta-D-ribofuranose 2-oxidase